MFSEFDGSPRTVCAGVVGVYVCEYTPGPYMSCFELDSEKNPQITNVRIWAWGVDGKKEFHIESRRDP